MKTTLTNISQKKKSTKKNVISLLFALAIAGLAFFIYSSHGNNSLSLPEKLGFQSKLHVKNSDWEKTFFGTPAYKALQVVEMGSQEVGALGNKDPFSRLKK